uniref:Uncharacterized protein n=1 Tax=Anas platyrhynchos TaxID=8839 RepID=A0A8B9SJK4_ANAPL
AGAGFLAVLLLHEFIHRPRVLQPQSPARLPRVQESPAAYWEEAHAARSGNDREGSLRDGYLLMDSQPSNHQTGTGRATSPAK